MRSPCRSFAIDFARFRSCCLCSVLSRYLDKIVPCRMRSSPAAEMRSARAERTLRHWFRARSAGYTGTSTSERAATGSARYSRKNSLSLTALSVASSASSVASCRWKSPTSPAAKYSGRFSVPSVVGALPRTILPEPVEGGVDSVYASRSASSASGDSIIVGPASVVSAAGAAPVGGPVDVTIGRS